MMSMKMKAETQIRSPNHNQPAQEVTHVLRERRRWRVVELKTTRKNDGVRM